MKVPIDKVLAATATSVFSIGNGVAVPFFDTAASSSPEETAPYEISDAASTIDKALLFDFDFAGWFTDKMQIPGDSAFIRFKREPVVKMNVSREILIPDWGVSLPIEKTTIDNLRTAVVRQYVMLAEKSRQHTLTGQDRIYWKQLLADSDYGDFCQRTAPSVRDSGRRIRAIEHGVEVVWSSGESEVLGPDFAKQLSIVEDGETFLARVKFIDYKLASLAEVTPLGKISPVDLDDLFGAA